MSLCAIIPIANIVAANTALEEQGFGPQNFSVPAYTGQSVTHGALHAWDDAAFIAAVKVIANVVWDEGTGDPVTRTADMIAGRGAKWGANAPALPSSGNVTAGRLYRFEDRLWSVIQTFSRTTYSEHPSTYPAMICAIHEPGVVLEWIQPLYEFNAYKLVNPFNGRPDECIYQGKRWKVTQADGAGNNVYAPGVYGWTVVT